MYRPDFSDVKAYSEQRYTVELENLARRLQHITIQLKELEEDRKKVERYFLCAPRFAPRNEAKRQRLDPEDAVSTQTLARNSEYAGNIFLSIIR
jgi:hypothetical protein